MKAAILAIGTELTSGQITNRNSAWIAQKLEDLGISAPLHLTVPDDRAAIADALAACEKNSDLIFVTGGLGPTSDDFTRELIADWAQSPLQWNEPAWRAIETRLTQLGVLIAESNRRQCYFPEIATPLPNPAGTAQGFALTVRGKKVFVLPGPPKEIAAIWEGAIASALATLADHAAPVLLKWQCLGLSESALGEIVEKIIAGSELKSGYRAHRPIIEVKIWCPRESLSAHSALIARLETELAPWIISRGEEDVAQQFVQQLAQFCAEKKLTFRIQDQVTHGALAARVSAHLAQTSALKGVIQIEFRALEPAEKTEGSLTLILQPDLKDERGFYAVAQWGDGEHVEKIKIPYPPGAGELRVRADAFSAEKALAVFTAFFAQARA